MGQSTLFKACRVFPHTWLRPFRLDHLSRPLGIACLGVLLLGPGQAANADHHDGVEEITPGSSDPALSPVNESTEPAPATPTTSATATAIADVSESEPEEGYGVSGTDVDGPEDPSGYGKGTGEGDDTGDADEDAPKFSVELPWSTHLKIGGQYRARGEVRAHGAYQSGGGVAAETDFVEQRIRLNFDFQVLEHVRAFIEAQDSRVWGDTGLNKDEPEDEIDLRQGYVEFSFKKLWQVPVKVRAGRYEVPQLGDQRLISSLDWSNVTRQWDGVQATYETDALWATAFAQNIREGHTETTGASANDDFWLTGAYVSFRAIPDTWLDGFLYWRDLSDRTFTNGSGGTGERRDFTFGGRVKTKVGPLGLSGTAALQFGDQAGDDVEAFAIATRAWLEFLLGEEQKLTIGLEYAHASGDKDPTDGRTQTFDPILPFGHYHHGHMDLVGWRNLHTTSLALAFWPWEGFSVHADNHYFWLAEKDDAWYGAGGGPVRSSTAADSNYVGAELDLYVKVKAWKRVFIWTGYSHFFAGPYVGDTGKDRDQDWAFLLFQVGF